MAKTQPDERLHYHIYGPVLKVGHETVTGYRLIEQAGKFRSRATANGHARSHDDPLGRAKAMVLKCRAAGCATVDRNANVASTEQENVHEMALRHRLMVYRAERGLTQAQLAELLGMSRRMVNAIEKGRAAPRRLSLKLKIAQVVGLPVSDLLDSESPQQR